MGEGLNKLIASELYRCFCMNCISLIGEACDTLKKENKVSIDWEEENITANIKSHIEKSPNAIRQMIFVADEVRLYTTDILDGKRKSKNAPRIDLVLQGTWDNTLKINYYVETKILILHNCKKIGRKSLISAIGKQKRYIKTGIDNFCNGTYPVNGSMLGYILEGESSEIVSKINTLLKKADRKNEQLVNKPSTIVGIDACYSSVHTNFKLDHFFVCF